MSSGKLPERAAANLTTTELVKEITSQVGLLVRKQIELAKTELRADVKREVVTVRNFGIAALAALVGLNMLFVTGALALALVLPAWLAALIVAVAALLVAAIAAGVGWGRRLRRPMARSRQTLQDDLHFTKERTA
jgi:hypothetical protein